MSSNPLQQSELWEIARQLVSFDTVSASSNVQAAEYLATFLEDSGFSVLVALLFLDILTLCHLPDNQGGRRTHCCYIPMVNEFLGAAHPI